MFKRKQRLTPEQYKTVAETLGMLQEQRSEAVKYSGGSNTKVSELDLYFILIEQILSKTTGINPVIKAK